MCKLLEPRMKRKIDARIRGGMIASTATMHCVLPVHYTVRFVIQYMLMLPKCFYLTAFLNGDLLQVGSNVHTIGDSDVLERL